jgi:SPP1 gp7 family putative phage head morphogenesis protein
MGMIAGDDNTKITNRVIGTNAMQGKDGVTQSTRNQVHTITRTAVMDIAGNARKMFFDANSDVINEELFVATLDSRTTPICRSLDGHTFPLKKGPVPPLHFCCRSCRVAVIDNALAGQRPANPTTQKQLLREWSTKQNFGTPILNRDGLPKGSKGAFDKWATGRKRELIGPVPAKTNYQSWLSRQSNHFQEEVMGVTKAKLFRDGGLTLDRFVDANGNELTLSQLARADAEAFRKAGLDPGDFK